MAGAGTLGRQTITALQASGSELTMQATVVTLPVSTAANLIFKY
jgi:hypothetical protein